MKYNILREAIKLPDKLIQKLIQQSCLTPKQIAILQTNLYTCNLGRTHL